MGYIGESCALLATLSFASASMLFSQTVKNCSPLLLNLLRGLVSIFLTFITLYLFSENVFPDDTAKNYFLLIVSGILGIAAGDTLYFIALENIGARLTILLETLAPTFTGIVSYFYFGQTLSLLGWIGIILTCGGIYIVVNEKQNQKHDENEDIELGIELVKITNDQLLIDNAQLANQLKQQQQQTNLIGIHNIHLNSKKKVYGIICGVAFTLCEALGMVLSYDGMQSGKFSSFQSTLLRILAGTVGVGLIFGMKKGEKFKNPCKTKRDYILFLIACTLSCYIGIWAQQKSITYTKPEISQTIMATAPIFSLVISWYQGEAMKIQYFIGSFIAIFGVCLIVWN